MIRLLTHPGRFPLSIRIAECVIIAFVIVIGLHLIVERITAIPAPGGDEGSWMAVAAQVARGEGFTTRWLEHPFLNHPTLPRPDDFRYPGFVLPLALAFKLFGISHQAGLWVAGMVFLLFVVMVHLTSRKAFGMRTAVISAFLTVLSLHQLYWCTIVYCEGMFGLMLGLLILWSCRNNPHTMRHAIILGVSCGLLYHVRPNGILAGCGIIWFYFRNRARIPQPAMLVCLGALIAVISPWMVRSWLIFGNPFHIASGAGLLRASSSEPLTLTFVDFIIRHGPLHIVKATAIGTVEMVRTIHWFEHGLEVLPAIGLIIGLLRRKPFYNPFVAVTFLISFLACGYTAYQYSWAGARYFAPFLPFVYAYGVWNLITAITDFAPALATPGRKGIVTAVLTAILLAPVVMPHRYYERVLPGQRVDHPFHTEHVETLDSLLPKNGEYLAGRMAQLNFLTTYRCIGVQDYFDSTYVKWAARQFSPSLLVVAAVERPDARLAAVVREYERSGYSFTLVKSTAYADYHTMSRTTGE